MKNKPEKYKCWICNEEILDFEQFFTETINNEVYYIHDRLGCRDVWEEVINKPHKCCICGKKTLNLIYFGGHTFIVHSGLCTDKLRNQLGLVGIAKKSNGGDR